MEGIKHSEDIMWQAVVACDKKYDGDFFYAVKTVGVYCRPSCKSRTPLRQNILFFVSAAAAEQAGFRPCKRCRPDLLAYAPLKELAAQAKDLIDGYFREKERLAAEMKRLGVSANYLTAVFKQSYGLSAAEYLAQKRLEYAKELLVGTNEPILNVAGEVGFDSLSSFYAFFKGHTGITPKNYRDNRTAGNQN